MSSASPTVLKTVVFLGSSRNMTPFWGGPARLGTRVLKYVVSSLSNRPVQHEVTVFDPLDLQLPVLEAPQFHYKPGEAPGKLNELQKVLAAADCFVIVSPEYNHSIPPALSNMMSYFGASNYACKPSGIVTYSAGQWGGMRAAVALRPFLSELGTLSVSRICGIPNAQDEFSEDGVPVNVDKWEKMLGGMLNQLEWMAVAMKNQREAVGLPK